MPDTVSAQSNTGIPQEHAAARFSLAMFPSPKKSVNPYLQRFADAMEKKTELHWEGLLSRPFLFQKEGVKRIVHLQWIEAVSMESVLGWMKGENNKKKAKRRWIMFHVRYFFLLLLIFSAKMLRRIKVVWTIHDAPRLDVHPLLMAILRKIYFFLADAYVVHAESAKHDIPRRYRIKPVIFLHRPNFIGEYGPIASKEESERMREKLGLPKDSIVFLAFGYLRTYKNIEFIVDAFHEYKEKNQSPKAYLLITGKTFDQSVTDEILHIVSDANDIIFQSGLVPDEEVRLLLGAVDYVIIGQERGYTSGVMFLAMSYCRPVLIRDWGAAPLYIRDGINGFFFDWNTLPRVLEKAIVTRKNKVLYEKMCLDAIATMKPLTWERMAAQLIPYYRKLLEL
jgi:glycosyltransferase involved in cell wall biosynthesis